MRFTPFGSTGASRVDNGKASRGEGWGAASRVDQAPSCGTQVLRRAHGETDYLFVRLAAPSVLLDKGHCAVVRVHHPVARGRHAGVAQFKQFMQREGTWREGLKIEDVPQSGNAPPGDAGRPGGSRPPGRTAREFGRITP